MSLGLGRSVLYFSASPSLRLKYWKVNLFSVSLSWARRLVLNALVGWWWADPVAALIMVPIIVKEGWNRRANTLHKIRLIAVGTRKV
ncbi:MAG TPA: hypothetical protein DC054_04835 [Blastocatellia bacterium]|nr:hypothetical protein [Blastocatellia bacterium]